jgi:hypothetical protein
MVADHQCAECKVYVCDLHGPLHEEHSQFVDADVITTYLQHVSSRPLNEQLAQASAAQATAGNASSASAAPKATSIAGCKAILTELGVNQRDIVACDNNLKVLQALVRVKKGKQPRTQAASAISRDAITGSLPVINNNADAAPRTASSSAPAIEGVQVAEIQVPVQALSQPLAFQVDTSIIAAQLAGAFANIIPQLLQLPLRHSAVAPLPEAHVKEQDERISDDDDV